MARAEADRLAESCETFYAHQAAKTPNTAPDRESRTDSVEGGAPSAACPREVRTANSCCRAAPRASNRIEALAQPMTSSSTAAANEFATVPRVPPHRRSERQS